MFFRKNNFPEESFAAPGEIEDIIFFKEMLFHLFKLQSTRSKFMINIENRGNEIINITKSESIELGKIMFKINHVSIKIINKLKNTFHLRFTAMKNFYFNNRNLFDECDK